MPSERPPTNTLVITNVSEQVLRDPSELMSYIATAASSTTLELVSLPRLSRLILVCRSIETAIRLKSLIHDSDQWKSLITSFSLADNVISDDEQGSSATGVQGRESEAPRTHNEVSDHLKHLELSDHCAFLELPLQEGSRRFLISPPVSPPADWNYWDKVEEGPNTKAVHSPDQLSHLLWERLGGLDGATACKYREEAELEEHDSATTGRENQNVNSGEIVDISHGQEILFRDIHTNVPAIMLDSVDSNTASAKPLSSSSSVPGRPLMPKTSMPS